MIELATSTPPESFGRYVLHPAIARGGMATVHTARLVGAEGFSRLVAVKRLHPQFTNDPDFVAMFLDEARIASNIHHPNVVPVLDVVVSGQEVLLVQEYVHGVPLDELLKASLHGGPPMPTEIVVAIVTGVLSGLHAVHDSRDESGEPLDIVHRDVSPQNVIVSADGIPRLLDFGIAKARTSAHHTREGYFKGKLAYMAPEQIRSERVTPRADVYATGVLMWELLVNRRFHQGLSDVQLVAAVATGDIPTLTEALEGARAWIDEERWDHLTALDSIVSRSVSAEPEDRFASAAAMREAVLVACRAATPLEVAEWIKTVAPAYLERRQRMLASNDERWRSHSRLTAAAPLRDGATTQILIESASGVAPLLSSLPPSASTFTRAVDRELGAASLERSRRLPWLVAGGLLVVVGVLLGVLGARSHEDPSSTRASNATSAPPPVAPSPVEVAPAAPVLSARPTSTTNGQRAAQPVPAATTTAAQTAAQAPPTASATSPAPTPLTFSGVRVPPPQRWWPTAAQTHPAGPAPQAVSTTAPLPPATSRSDCTPPFYFEGSKKVFKPNCL